MILFRQIGGGNIEVTKPDGEIVTVPDEAVVKENCCTSSVYIRFEDPANDLQINYNEGLSIDGGEMITGVDKMGTALSAIFSDSSGGSGSDGSTGRTVTNITDAQLKNRVLTDSVSATGEMTVDGQPLDGETFVIGVSTYTFKDAAIDPTDVEIGATKADTQNNIVTVVTNNIISGQISAFVADIATITADSDIGADGNDTATTSAATNVSFSTATLEGGEDATYRTPIPLLEVPAGKVAYDVKMLVQKKFVTGYDEVGEYSFIVYREGDIESAIELQDGHMDFSASGEENIQILPFDNTAAWDVTQNILFSSAGYENVEGGNAANKLRIVLTYLLADRLT